MARSVSSSWLRSGPLSRGLTLAPDVDDPALGADAKAMAGIGGERDPIIGLQEEGATFTIPKEPVRRRVHGIETFNVGGVSRVRLAVRPVLMRGAMLTNHFSVAAMLFAAFGLAVGLAAGPRIPTLASRIPVEGEMPSLAGATGWLNSPPLTTAGLRGKVVLVDIWTYTCINWLRTHPEPSSYASKFSGKYAHRTIDGGVGHNLPQEAPEAFAKAVVDVDGF